MQHFIQKLQSTVQVDFHPAGSVLDALPRVVWPPALDEAQPQDTQPPEIIDTDSCCRRKTCEKKVRERQSLTTKRSFPKVSIFIWWESMIQCHICYIFDSLFSTLLTDCRRNSPDAAWPRDVASYGCSLSSCSCLGCGCLLLHLPVTLPEVKHLQEEKT